MRCTQLFVFHNSKPPRSIHREYQGISLASSPANTAILKYGQSRYTGQTSFDSVVRIHV